MNISSRPIATLPIKPGEDSTIGSILLELGKLQASDIERVLHVQKESGLLFGESARTLNLITEADVLQVLARQFHYPYLQPGQGKYPAELVAAYQPFSAQVEMLRTVRSQLVQNWFATGRKALVVASINQGDGASFFAANLAVAFSQLGEHTLMIDANLRRPRQHEIFNLKGRQGLSNVLAGRAGMETFTKVDSFPNLSVLPAGTLPPNPQELICSSSFSEFTATLSNRFDITLIDVPAFSLDADAFTIAARIGGVLLVCRRNKTRVSDLNVVAKKLARSGTEVVGSVLTDF